MSYEPNKKSLKKHEVPEWFHDAKLGIFVHWGLYSVPAFALTGLDIVNGVKEKGFKWHYKNNPYAEWYLNSLRIPDSPTQKYQQENYGEDFNYDDFIPIFNEASKKWDPKEMVDIFKRAGVKYVVLVTKHHDGFLLWPSKYSNPKKDNYTAKRDIVGELTDAVKSKGMKMGLYYSGTIDWSFNLNPIIDMVSFATNGVMTSDYIEYANNHWYELIDTYEPIILWNDIGYPPGTNVYEIFAYFYNKFPDGVINDRWGRIAKWMRKAVKFRPISAFINWIARKVFAKEGASTPTTLHHDYKTPEYSRFKKIQKKKWECTRGIGNSFGYNKFEIEEVYLSSEELIHMFIDIVSKNGNLLLNVGPMADGTIPEIQKERLSDLGKWLEVNGEAIFGTRPWIRPESITLDNIEVRYTQKQGLLFAILLDRPKSDQITIKNLKIDKNFSINLLNHKESLTWKQDGENLTISIPENLEDAPAYAFKILL